mmetsp:Transcript_18852/g.20983  ORF Transcript_18852/g.20983 Transcript_18852/m.20983 type:complete len:491 (-) Transcript_18852:7-1479(-)
MLSNVRSFFQTFQIDLTNKVTRAFALVVVVFFGSTTCGILFGWASMQLVYKSEGVYLSLCPAPEATNSTLSPLNTTAINGTDTSTGCEEQELRLNLVFTISTSVLLLMNVPLGYVVDYIGPRLTSLLGFIGLIFSSILIAFGSPSFDSYIPGFIFLSISGFAVYQGFLKLSDAFQGWKVITLSVVSTSFDASSGVFLIFWYTHREGGVSSQDLLLYYLLIPFLGVIWIFFWPTGVESDEPRKIQKLKSQRRLDLVKSEKSTDSKTVYRPYETLSFWKQMMTAEYIFLQIYMAFFLLWLNAMFPLVQARAEEIVGEERAIFMVELFSILQPASFIFAPLFALFNEKIHYRWHFTIVHLLFLIFSGLLFIPYEAPQYAAYVVFSTIRMYFFGVLANFISKVFGFRNFGRLYGVLGSINGIVSFLIYGVSALALNTFQGEFLVVNIIQVVCISLLSFFPIFLFTAAHSKTMDPKYAGSKKGFVVSVKNLLGGD